MRKFALVSWLFVALAGTAGAQSTEDGVIVSIAVDPGVPLRVSLTQKVPFRENAPVHGRLIEPIYAFDREVIPAGTRIEGVITGFRNAGKWRRISAMLSGNFTPLREPEIAFHDLILPNGRRIELETVVGPGTDIFAAAETRPTEDSAFTAYAPSEKRLEKEVTSWLWGVSPVRPQYIPAGTQMNAVLVSPLDFGTAEYEMWEFDSIGAELPEGSSLSARLVTPVNSRTADPGTPLEALTTRPVFSPNHRLILPVGSRLSGEVTTADRARALRRNGQLAFTFTSVAPPDFWTWTETAPQPIEGKLDAVRVGKDMKGLRIGADGKTRLVESPKRFIAPAWALIRSYRSLNATADSFDDALAGAYQSKLLKEVTGAGPGLGLGLPASISGAMVPPVGIGFAFFGAGRSIYSTFLKRGRDINLPANTLMEIRVKTRE
jgi:hypothetical protein